jgi:hypothetical protein
MMTIKLLLPTFRANGFLFMAILSIFLFFNGNIKAQSCNPLPSFDVTYTDGNIINGALLIDKKIRVTGTVTFNTAIMKSCTLLMDPGANIIIKKSFSMYKSASGNPSIIYGCGGLWNSIQINAGASVKWADCVIQNGNKGLLLMNGYKGAESSMSRCKFINNITGITAWDVSALSFSYFAQNEFRYDGNPSSMLPPYTTQAIIGISISTSTGSIGSAGGANVFSGLSFGIRVDRSVVSINNCNFMGNNLSYINPSKPGAIPVYFGIGISASSSLVTVVGTFTDGASCTFINNRYDIVSFSTKSLIVKNARFTDPVAASIVVYNSNIPNNIEIRDKNFFLLNSSASLPLESWVQIERAAQTGGQSNTVVFDNDFLILPALFGGLSGTRILNFTAMPGAADVAAIRVNRIDCRYGNPSITGNTRTIHGIMMSGANSADGYHVFDNNIRYDQVTPLTSLPNDTIGSFAIAMFNNMGTRCEVTRNYIRSQYMFGNNQTNDLQRAWLRCGTHLSNSPNVMICNNNVGDVTNHYHFTSNSSNIEFGKNTTTNTGSFGLNVTGNTIPNNHDHRHNMWLGTYSTNGAEGNNGFSNNIKWRVDPAKDPSYMPPSQLPLGWFLPIPEPLNLIRNCENSNFVPENPPTGETVVHYINGDYNFTNTTAIRDFEKDLLYQMIRYPATYSNNAVATQFYNSKQNTVLWQLANARNMLLVANTPTVTDQTTYQQLLNNIGLNIDEVGNKEKAESLDLSSIDSLLQTDKCSLLSATNTIQINLEAMAAQIRTQRLPLLTAALNYIDAIPATDVLDINEQKLLQLVAKNCMEQEWTDADYVTLRNIAHLCPDAYGSSVSTAREMLPSHEANQFVLEGYDPYCRPQNGRSSTETINGTFTVYPNPANDLLQIGFPAAFSGTVQLIAVSGQVSWTRTYSEANNIVVPTAQLESGVYWVRCLALDGNRWGKTIIITH